MPRRGAEPVSREPALRGYPCRSNEASRVGRPRQPDKPRQRSHTPSPRRVGQHRVDGYTNERINDALAFRSHRADCSAGEQRRLRIEARPTMRR